MLSRTRSVVPKDLSYKQRKKQKKKQTNKKNIKSRQEIVKKKVFEPIKAGLVVGSAVAGTKSLITK